MVNIASYIHLVVIIDSIFKMFESHRNKCTQMLNYPISYLQYHSVATYTLQNSSEQVITNIDQKSYLYANITVTH